MVQEGGQEGGQRNLEVPTGGIRGRWSIAAATNQG
jgi:hypothetical protein